jgi:hypothetical protein
VSVDPRFFRWLHIVWLGFMWLVALTPRQGREWPPTPFLLWFCGLATLWMLWFLPGFKWATVSSGLLTVRAKNRELEIPFSQVIRVQSYPWYKGYSYVSIVVSGRGLLGRYIRLKTRSPEESDRVAHLLEAKVEKHARA